MTLRLDRQIFFSEVREGPFRGRLTQRQVDGMSDLLDAWETYGTRDPRHLAYTLATDYHETGGRMQPVREGFASSDAKARKVVANRRYGQPAGPWGHVYYGRGDVQLTWYENYVRLGDILGLPLAEQPDLVLQSSISKRILIEGMSRGVSSKGDFTGKALEDYFNETRDDPEGARRIVNGTDRASLIAGYHEAFLQAVQAALEPELALAPVTSVSPPSRPAATDEASWGAVLTGLGGAGGAVAALIDKVKDPYALAALAVIVVGLAIFFRGRLKLVKETGQ